MTEQSLVDVVRSLDAKEQECVRQFIDFLKKREQSYKSPFLRAADEFTAEHPELLRRLAQ